MTFIEKCYTIRYNNGKNNMFIQRSSQADESYQFAFKQTNMDGQIGTNTKLCLDFNAFLHATWYQSPKVKESRKLKRCKHGGLLTSDF
jgi:hypothetical protein